MKIGIVGNYGNNNQGDEAILEGVLIQMEQAYDVQRHELLVFTNSPEQTQEKFGVQVQKLYDKKSTAPTTLFATIRSHRTIIRELDLLVIGGGGILMDLYTHSLVLFGMYGKIAQYTKTPYVIFGAGAGPIQTWKGRIILKSLVNHAKIATVRDEASKNVLKSIGVTKAIDVIADPAFYLPAPTDHVSPNETKQIGVTAVPYFHANYWPRVDEEKYEAYVSGMATNLEELIKENSNIHINFFATKHPQDTAVSKDIVERMVHKEQCSVYDRRLDQQEILTLIGEQDMIIGTRLHSLILAIVASKPVIAVAYHHKVSDFMKENHVEDYLLTMEQLNEKSGYFHEKYRDMMGDWNETISRFTSIANYKKENVLRGMDLVKKRMPLE